MEEECGGSEDRREAKRNMGFPIAISSGLEKELGWGEAFHISHNCSNDKTYSVIYP